MPDSIFAQIVRGEAPAHRVWEDDAFLAFLDLRPIRPGHTLLIPKEAPDSVFDLAPEVYAGLWERARRLEAPLREATGARRVGLVVEGFGVPHAHVHLVPIDALGDLDPCRQRPASHGELSALATRIREAIAEVGG